MERISLTVEKRELSGKKYARKYRRNGYVPCVVYNKDINLLGNIDKREFMKAYSKLQNPETAIFELRYKVNGEEQNYPSILKEIQTDPVNDDILHLDFYYITKGEKIHLTVPVYLVGEAVGVKKGGILEHLIRELEVRCYPDNIPEKIEVDISVLDIGDSIHVGDISIEGVEILEEPETVIVLVGAPKEEVEEETTEEEGGE